MKALNGIVDIVNNLGVLPGSEIVLVRGSASGAELFAFNDPNNRSVAGIGQMNEGIEGLDVTVGLKLSFVRAILKAPKFDLAKTLMSVSHNNGKAPMLKVITERSQHNIALMEQRLAEECVTALKLNPVTYQLTLRPTADGIQQFKHWNREQSAMIGQEVRFWPNVNGRGRLNFQFDHGMAIAQMMQFEFARGFPPVRLVPYTYPAQEVLAVLGLYSTSESLTMSFSNKGVLTIDVDSGLGKYKFHFGGGKDMIYRTDQIEKWSEVWELERIAIEDTVISSDFDPVDFHENGGPNPLAGRYLIDGPAYRW